MPTLRLDGFDLHYETAGSGTPLLFIHGLGSGLEDWAPQVAHFARDHFVIAADLRGHGRSGDPPVPYRMTDFAGDLARLLESPGRGPAHVVGVSLGGAIAFQLALDAPQLVRTLTVVNSGPELILRTWKERYAIWQRRKLVQWLGLPRFGAILGKKLFPDPAQAAQREAFVQRYRRNRDPAYSASLDALVGWSVSARLAELRLPVLILAADQDYTTVASKQAYTKQIAGAELVVVPDSHHALPMERPEAFNAALAAFLARHA